MQGRDYGNGKQVGPYVRLLTYDAGEEIMRQGEWGGNTFYIAIEGVLDVYLLEDGGSQRKISQLQPGTCFGEMALLAGIERNATISVPANTTAEVLEVARPALRLLRKLPKFGQILDSTYRAHGFGRVLEELTLITGQAMSPAIVEQLRRTAQYKVYAKHHVLCKEDEPIDRVFLIKSGWVRRSHGVDFTRLSRGGNGMTKDIGVDFLGEGIASG